MGADKPILKSNSYEAIRKGIECNKISAILTSMHLNQVLCKLMSKNSIAFLIDLNELKEKDSREKARFLEKIKKNAKICRKYKVTIKFLNSTKNEEVVLRKFLGLS